MDICSRKQALVEETGPWTAHNIHLGGDEWTIGPGVTGTSELNAGRILQAVTDLQPRPIEDLRVLDLGALEGLYSIELARLGAEVVAVEGRAANARKIEFARDVLGLARIEVRTEDVRALERRLHGEFDVVLALGILYHLPAADLKSFLGRVRAVCRRVAIFETQVALRGRERLRVDGEELFGLTFEEPDSPWSSIGNRESFWPTRASLLRVLAAAEFTTVVELASPIVESLAEYRDHVTLAAFAGRPLADVGWRVPERVRRIAHPAQGGRHLLGDRLRGLLTRRPPRVFRKD